MRLVDIIRMQREFDQKHGWTPNANDPVEICDFLARDLIGLFGEMGEFANVVKKIQLATSTEMGATLDVHAPALKEELVDFFIYVLRFASHLELDLEKGYLEKLSANEVRFRHFLCQPKENDSKP